ncbi:tRNA (N(6)-L-threonylcarbamoyladenosine(37)-C(2))-methylthiotransferase MtaB [Campylobacter sputorum]|uniref:tRNA (N(6)-L-threonylcarbamoyladenosine(37)-C(2))- methylthiotransferase MtaB n=1 Tax=Campylobacter sputorum TaxID=206 RepID=UPI00053BFEE9|nr:tRNA (N(6)-L-threonylcarbamoyladenosine(37)-C(2))-methylthiotransferase MtaB [Campylobacter sputorum]
MRVYIKTFGCRTNIYDSELIKQYASDAAIVENEKDADIIIVNSCTVTNGADFDCRNYIHHAKALGKKVIMTGCGAISRGKELYDNGDLFGVFGMSQKKDINKFINSKAPFYDIGNLQNVDENALNSYNDKTKAFIKIQEGCNFRCSYCIIPSVRGKSRSMNEEGIINEVSSLVDNGFSEFVLTGTNIGSYGNDTNSTLGKLLGKLGNIKGLKRIRLGSLEPSQIDDSFKEILNESWLERHLHIAIQHTSQKMLNIMRRRNKFSSDLELFTSLNELGFALGTDFIVGHPGESEEIWDEALENFKKMPLTHLHAFVYSKRENTHSATLTNNINGIVSKERLKLIKKITENNCVEFRNKHKKPLEILVERLKGDYYEGYDQYYIKSRIKSNKNLAKKWIKVDEYDIKNEANYCKF